MEKAMKQAKLAEKEARKARKGGSGIKFAYGDASDSTTSGKQSNKTSVKLV